MCFLKPISISLSPNTEKDDNLLALKLRFKPWLWKKGKAIEETEGKFKSYLGVKYAVSFNSGRSALMAILAALQEGQPSSVALARGDEVLLQAFTCNAVPNPIIWSGLKPIYVDCDEKTLNIDIEDLKRTLRQAQGKKPKILIVQHTFGLPADMDEILEICRENNLILIEDCAHSLGATYKGKSVGTFGKAAFFSFGRDKIISSVYGGMTITNDDELANKIRDFQEKLEFPSNFWIFQQLLHPILVNFLILPLYGFFEIGRLILIFLQKIKVLSKGVSEKEKRGEKPTLFPKKLPNALAILALNQFNKLEKFISHQREIAKFYDENLRECGFILPEDDPERIYMRYSVLIENYDTDGILRKTRKQRIFLDDGWRKAAIVPPDTNQTKMQYIQGSCPKAEKIAKNILNLPTHINISQKDAQKIIEFLKQGDEVYPLQGFPSSSSSSRKAGLDMEVKEIENKESWESFLANYQEKSFLQSWNWGDFQIKMGNKIWRLGVFDDNKLVAAALITKIKARRGKFLLIQHLLKIKPQVLEVLLKYLKEIAKKENCIFIRVSFLWERNEENQKIFKQLGFKEAPMHANAYEATWKLDLSPSEAELLMGMRKTTRYLIRQALKNQDITIERSERLDDVETYQKLNQEIGKRQNFVPFSFEYIKNEFEVFGKDSQVSWFFGKYKGEVAASALIVFWSKVGFYHQAASSFKYTKFPIPYLLQWEAIKEAKKRGCVFYDFWGYVDPQKTPRHPWAGPTLFKMGFGGRTFEYVKTQDFSLSKKYWLTYLFEKLRRSKRGL